MLTKDQIEEWEGPDMPDWTLLGLTEEQWEVIEKFYVMDTTDYHVPKNPDALARRRLNIKHWAEMKKIILE